MLYNRILMIQMSAMGSILFALPSLSLLRDRYPNAQITWVVRKKYADVLEEIDGLDQILVVPELFTPKWQRRDPFRKINLSGYIEAFIFLFRLWHQHFDLVINFQNDTQSNLFSWLTRAHIRIGHLKELRGEWGNFLNTVKVEVPANIHTIEQNFHLLTALGVDAPKILALPFKESTFESEETQKFFDDNHSNQVPIIGLHLGAGWERKKWPFDYFMKLASKIYDNGLGQPLILSSPDDWELTAKASKILKEKYWVSPSDSFKSLLCSLKKCDLVVGSDSGPAHLAQLLGIKTVMLFGPTDMIKFGPYSSGTTLSKKLACSPCWFHEPTYKKNCPEYRCMNEITVEEVLQKIQSELMENVPVN